MATCTWISDGTTTIWSDSNNWDNGVPGSSDDVIFDGSSSYESTIDSGFAGTVASLVATSDYSGNLYVAKNLIVTGIMSWNGTGSTDNDGITQHHISVRGNYTPWDTAIGGTVTILIDGTGDQYIAPSGYGSYAYSPEIQIVKSSGNFTMYSTFALLLTPDGYNQSDFTVNLTGTATWDMGGVGFEVYCDHFYHIAGDITNSDAATSFRMYITTGYVGTVGSYGTALDCDIETYSTSATIDMGSITIDKLVLCSSGELILTSDIATNTFYFGGGYINTSTGKKITVTGDYEIAYNGQGGNILVEMTGSSNASIIMDNYFVYSPDLKINKSSNAVVNFSPAYTLNISPDNGTNYGDFTMQAGKLDLQSSTTNFVNCDHFYHNGGQIGVTDDTGWLSINPSTGYVGSAGSWGADATLDFQSYWPTGEFTGGSVTFSNINISGTELDLQDSPQFVNVSYNSGLINGSEKTLKISGNLYVEATTGGDATIEFNGTGNQTVTSSEPGVYTPSFKINKNDGDMTVTPAIAFTYDNGANYAPLIITKTGGTGHSFTFSDQLISGDLTLTAGEVNSTGMVYCYGDIVGTAGKWNAGLQHSWGVNSKTMNGGSVEWCNGYALTIDNGDTLTLTGNLILKGGLNIANGTFATGNYTMTISGDFNIDDYNGTFDGGNGKVIFDSNSIISGGLTNGMGFYDLNMETPDQTILFGGGIYSVPPPTFSVSHKWTAKGTDGHPVTLTGAYQWVVSSVNSYDIDYVTVENSDASLSPITVEHWTDVDNNLGWSTLVTFIPQIIIY